MAAPTGSAQARQQHSPGRFDADRDRTLFPQPFSRSDVDAALRDLPSHGWTAGWTGRRDRALLVLSYMAGLSYDNIATLTVGDVTISDGTATIRTPGGTTILRQADDGLLCGPCALARWLHALDMTMLYPNGRVIAAVIARAVPLTAESPHLCLGSVTVTEPTQHLTLMAATDQWGLCGTGDIAAPASGATDSVRSGPAPSGLVRSGPVRSGQQPASPIPSQRVVGGGGPIVAMQNASSWSSPQSEAEDMSARFDRLALGLEGRARQLLGRSTTDVAI